MARISAPRILHVPLGAHGINLEYPVIRHINNLESVPAYEGASEVHQLVLGRALTGESASAEHSARRRLNRNRSQRRGD